MTELAIREDLSPVQSAAPAALVEWAQAASAAHQLATPLCQTSFVPAHFAGKPQEATAAILYGAEAGLSPLQSLQGIYVIGGRPAMYARTLMAVVLSHGHEVWTEELTDTRAIVSGRRKGSGHEERVVVTMDQARKAGWTRNQKYTSEPQAMLLARAQSMICRRLAPDALMGIAYSVEEIEDEQQPTATVSRGGDGAARKVSRRKPEPEPAPEPDFEPVAAEEPPAEPVEGEPLIAEAQSKKLHASFNDIGITDRADRLAYASSVIGREVTSSKDLTKVEATAVIDRLVSDGAGGAA